MGVHPNIAATKFPAQGNHLGAAVKVCFNYDTSQEQFGKIVRDDMEDPFRMIIHLLDENLFILATECQYRIL